MEQQIIYTNFVEQTVDALIDKFAPDITFILVDHNTNERVLPRLLSICHNLKQSKIIRVAHGDENKNIQSLTYIWKEMSERGATRHSLLINLGGGMITDMGAFAAATFKRGLKFINIPTTLLAAVDAAIGGKTGINFNGLKNEIGAFKNADAVIISTTFLGTLPTEEIKSGYAEMLKHAIISDAAMTKKLTGIDISEIGPDSLLEFIEESNEVKKDIVSQDPHEQNIRKALNFGHTVGHAFESLAMKRYSPIPHGYAVAYGMVVELILSAIKLHFPKSTLIEISRYILANYSSFNFSKDEIHELIEYMRHDKKNISHNKIVMTLLKNIGEVEINVHVTDNEIKAALEIYSEKILY